MTGPPLPSGTPSERMEKRTEQHQLLLASCGTRGCTWHASCNRCKSPSLATTTASASAHVPYYKKKKHFVALLGSFTPVWIYFLYSISSLQKLLRPSFVTDAVHKGRSRPHFRAGDRFRSDRGTGPLFQTSGSFFGPRGVTLETTNQKRGKQHDVNRTHTLGTTTNDKQINYFTPRASNELKNDPFCRIAASTSSGKCTPVIHIHMRHICITACHIDRRPRIACRPERERKKKNS